jgi:hypothetical protein
LSSGNDTTARTLELLRQLVPCSRCALLEVGAAGEHALAVTPRPAARDQARLARKLGGLFHLILDDEEPDASDDGDAVAPDSVHLALPVVAMDRTIGVLFVERDAGEPFELESLRVLSLVAVLLGAHLATLRHELRA